MSVGALRDFYGALAGHTANGVGYFITTNMFTLEAKKFAEDKPIELIDGFELLRYIRLANQDKKENFNQEKNIFKEIEKCPKCNGNFVERLSRYGKFLGCSNYPKCRYIKDS